MTQAGLFFVGPVPVGLHGAHAPAKSHARIMVVRMTASGGGGSGSGSVSGRLREFSSFDGDRDVQEALVRELAVATRRAQSLQVIDERIQRGKGAMVDRVSELYNAGARKLEEEHNELARRAALPQMKQWNRAIIEHRKQSAAARALIDAELADVEKLLRRVERGRRRSGKRKQSGTGPVAGTVLTAGFTAAMLGTFESVAARDNGPVVLAELGSVSLLLILLACTATVNSSPSSPPSESNNE